MQAEGGVVSGVAVFPRAEQEEEGKPREVAGGPAILIGAEGGKGGGVVEKLDGDRLDTAGGRVSFGPGTIEV